jgi:PD-(D/E)XK nuclease superfamily
VLRDRPAATYDPDMGEAPSRQELEAAYCWEPGDHVPGRPEMTDFRRRLRYHQARWREANGHPVGSQPIAPKLGGRVRPVGSRLPLDYARETGANFLTAGALEAMTARTSVIEPHQTVDHQRLWAELLWSPTMAFNLFGDLAADHALADRALQAWWPPEAPGTVSDVCFAHSPGRFDPEYLNSLRAFDTAFILDLDDGTQGIVGVAVNYYDWLKPETPRPSNLSRYLEVAERSGEFRPGALDEVKGRSGLCVTWLEHLLLLSMVQHVSGAWSWCRYVVVHPAGNSSLADGCARYRDLLIDDSTFVSATFEELLDANVLPAQTTAALRDRYLPGLDRQQHDNVSQR